METWHSTGLDHAATHAFEMEEDNQAFQINQLCHESELVNASNRSIRAQESCCASKSTFFVINTFLINALADIPSADQAVVVVESITSSELQTMVKRPRSLSQEMSILPESNSGTSKEPPKQDIQLIKRRRTLGSAFPKVACGELGSLPVSPSWSNFTNEEKEIGEYRGEDISTLRPGIANECVGDDFTHTPRKSSPYASVSLVSFNSEDGDVFADVSIPRPRCDNEYNLHTVGSEAEQEAETNRFEVNRVLTHRVRGRQIFYFVKWTGYSEPTWEPADHLDNCAEVLEQYWKTLSISSK